MSNLANSYRPTEFSQLIGQEFVAAVLEKMIVKDRVPSGLLFSGPSGTGKTSAARLVAEKLGGEIIEVDAASNGRVDDARVLMDSLKYSGGIRRVLILDEAHNMTREAFNVLLKPTEEPPAGVLFILVTTEPDRIPETVKTRLIEFEFRRVSAEALFFHLKNVSELEKFDVSDQFLKFIAGTSNGNVRTSLNSLSQIILSEIDTLEEFKAITGNENFGTGIVLTIVSQGIPEILTTLDKALARTSMPQDITEHVLGVLRDLLILKSGGSVGEVSADLKNIVPRVSRDELVILCRVLWDLKTKIKSSEDPRGNLQLAVVLMHETLNRMRGVVTPQHVQTVETLSQKEPKKLTLAEMRERLGNSND